MNIRHKLIGGYLIVSLLVMVVGGIGVQVTRIIDKEYAELEKEIVPLLEILEHLRFYGLRVVSSTSEYGFIKAEKIASRNSGQAPIESIKLGEEEEELINKGIKLYITRWMKKELWK